jgi:hypothetical protein
VQTISNFSVDYERINEPSCEFLEKLSESGPIKDSIAFCQLFSNTPRNGLTPSNPFFCQPHTPQHLFVLGSKEVGGSLVIILQFWKRKTWRNRKSKTCAICWLKSVLHEEKRRTGSDSWRTKATKTASDVFRHRNRTGKSYCRTRYDVGSERVNADYFMTPLRC